MNGGWIKLWRQSLNNKYYNKTPFDPFHAWLDLLLRADSNGNIEGTIAEFSARFKWSWDKTNRFIKSLETDKMITAETVRIQSRIQRGNERGIKLHIIKWKEFQDKTTERGIKRGINADSSADSIGNLPFNKNYKNIKEGENNAHTREAPAKETAADFFLRISAEEEDDDKK